jgi:hypothetical protein
VWLLASSKAYGSLVGAEQPAPPRPDERPRRLPPSSWITLVVAVGLALAAIALFPRSGGDSPPLASLALIGAVIAGVTTAALSVIVRRDLRLPARAATSLALAFVLIALVKFVLAPLGLYEVNAVRALEDVGGTVGDPAGATITAAIVFGLYALGYRIVYWLGHDGKAPALRRGAARERAPGSRSRRMIVVIVVVVLGLLALSWLWIVALLVLTAPRQYLEFVFSSGAGLLVAAALVGAATLIGRAFRTLERHPEIVDLGATVTLFWLGLGFLALFHALWIVYVLVLGSIWPLRTVVPK